MPDFDNTTLFPTFGELPGAPDDDPAAAESGTDASGGASGGSSWTLLAQVKENMTIVKPTLVVTDRAGVDFAVIFEDTSMSLKTFRKGYTMVVPGARRTEKGEGKKAFVRIEKGRCADVLIIPGSLEQLLELAKVVDSGSVGQQCAACGKTDGSRMRCTGCSAAAYCSKACQVKGWSELGHKANCKVVRSIKEIWT